MSCRTSRRSRTFIDDCQNHDGRIGCGIDSYIGENRTRRPLSSLDRHKQSAAGICRVERRQGIAVSDRRHVGGSVQGKKPRRCDGANRDIPCHIGKYSGTIQTFRNKNIQRPAWTQDHASSCVSQCREYPGFACGNTLCIFETIRGCVRPVLRCSVCRRKNTERCIRAGASGDPTFTAYRRILITAAASGSRRTIYRGTFRRARRGSWRAGRPTGSCLAARRGAPRCRRTSF